jgi:hypothetical protein
MTSIKVRNSFWFYGALAAMFASACCFVLWLDVVGRVSGWIVLPPYEAQIPRLQWYGGLWLSLAIILPFLAALLLGFSKKERPSYADSTRQKSVLTGSKSSYEWTSVVVVYVLRVGISFLGTLGFLMAFILIVSLLQKLPGHPRE